MNHEFPDLSSLKPSTVLQGTPQDTADALKALTGGEGKHLAVELRDQLRAGCTDPVGFGPHHLGELPGPEVEVTTEDVEAFKKTDLGQALEELVGKTWTPELSAEIRQKTIKHLLGPVKPGREVLMAGGCPGLMTGRAATWAPQEQKLPKANGGMPPPGTYRCPENPTIEQAVDFLEAFACDTVASLSITPCYDIKSVAHTIEFLFGQHGVLQYSKEPLIHPDEPEEIVNAKIEAMVAKHFGLVQKLDAEKTGTVGDVAKEAENHELERATEAWQAGLATPKPKLAAPSVSLFPPPDSVHWDEAQIRRLRDQVSDLEATNQELRAALGQVRAVLEKLDQEKCLLARDPGDGTLKPGIPKCVITACVTIASVLAGHGVPPQRFKRIIEWLESNGKNVVLDWAVDYDHWVVNYRNQSFDATQENGGLIGAIHMAMTLEAKKLGVSEAEAVGLLDLSLPGDQSTISGKKDA